LSESKIRISVVSKPFIVSAVICVFAGSIIGSIWMMSLVGADLAFARNSFPLHRIFQVDGFLTLLIMGVGYMIVPRFRNVQISSRALVYVSFILIVVSIASSVASTFADDALILLASLAQVIGISLFSAIIIRTLKIHPRLLRMADCFIALSVSALLAIAILKLVGQMVVTEGGNASSLTGAQMQLLFAILMIFGVEYKTLPSFLGFIRPRKKLSLISFGLAVSSIIFGLFSSLYDDFLLAEIFNIMLLSFVITFADAVYIFGGFDNSKILRLIRGEKKARYLYIMRHLRLAFFFLFAGILLAAAFNISRSYVLYDLAIHYTAIGFLGVTVALYLPLMLPPITGRMVHFTKFNILPLLLVVVALAIRTSGDIAMTMQLATIGSSSLYLFGISGWVVVVALFAFIMMIHSSMKQAEMINK
jgi:hypothetical protein